MAAIIKQISSLEKVRADDELNFSEIKERNLLQGERFSYQVVINAGPNDISPARVWVDAPEGISAKVYRVRDIIVDYPATEDISEENYIIKEPGYLPDVLVPIESSNNMISLMRKNITLWVKLDVDVNCVPGDYTVKVGVDFLNYGAADYCRQTETAEMKLTVIPAAIAEQKLIYTRWFYLDCISNVHNVEIFSEAHWELIEKYIEAAAELGVSMLLVPVHTPPLDTEVGMCRPCVQLVDIEKKGETYEFNFDKFHRYISLCKKYGIKYYEIAHLFSQWGSTSSPNIKVTENGKTDYMFGWHVAADSAEYKAFLPQYIKAITDALKEEGIAENAYFHVSDEPHPDNMDRYAIARSIIKPLIGDAKLFDALSHYDFCEKGLVECPVTSVSHIHEFLEHKLENQWVYYCCGPQKGYTNSFIAIPSARVRVLGFLNYKYDIKGFLHWGFNFYNAVHSRYCIDPYLTTSADGAFPSGDGFIVYPGKNNDVYTSIRGEVTRQAIEDMKICLTLERLIGREKVIEMIDAAAGCDIRFDDYPHSNSFLEDLRENMAKLIREISK